MAISLLDPSALRKVQKIVSQGDTLARLGAGVFNSFFQKQFVPDYKKGLPEKVAISQQNGKTSVNKFISLVKSQAGLGFYKSTRFYVSMNLPAAMTNVQKSFVTESDGALLFDLDSNRDMVFLCHTANMPGTQFESQNNFKDYTANGHVKRDVVYDYNYSDLNLNFFLDRDLNIKRFFETWANQIISKNTYAVNYYNDYVTDITLVCLNAHNDDPALIMEFKNAYVKAITSTNLSWADDPTPKDLEVQFGFETISYRNFVEKTLIDANTTDLTGITTKDQLISKLKETGQTSLLNTEIAQTLKESTSSAVAKFNQAKSAITDKIPKFF